MKLVPRIYQTSVEDWEVNCLMSVIEEEQRTLPSTPCGGPKLPRDTPPIVHTSGKRKASSLDQPDGRVFQFSGREGHRRKKTKVEQPGRIMGNVTYSPLVIGPRGLGCETNQHRKSCAGSLLN